jgi:hypothetical protein
MEDIRIVMAEANGAVWYRHPRANSLQHPHYRFLAFPAVHEFEQSPHWMVRADMSEKPCSVEYMARNFHLPDYPNDLNAVHESEGVLGFNKREMYFQELKAVMSNSLKSGTFVADIYLCHATARQRCEAFIKTVCTEKWKP